MLSDERIQSIRKWEEAVRAEKEKKVLEGERRQYVFCKYSGEHSRVHLKLCDDAAQTRLSGDVTAGARHRAAPLLEVWVQRGDAAEGPVRTSPDTPLIIKMLPDLTSGPSWGPDDHGPLAQPVNVNPSSCALHTVRPGTLKCRSLEQRKAYCRSTQREAQAPKRLQQSIFKSRKQDRELTVAQLMSSLLPNSDLNWRN